VTAVGSLLALAAALAAAAVIVGVVAPVRARVRFAGMLTAASATAAGAVGATVLVQPSRYVAEFADVFPLGGLRLEVDPLSAWFMVAAAVVAVPAAIYGIGYSNSWSPARPAAPGPSSRVVQASFPVLVWSALMVPTAGNVAGLLAFWELMALSSFVLVLAKHHHNPEARTAAQWYAGMTHLSLVAIALGAYVLAHEAGGESFAAIREGGERVGPAAASVVFVLALVGFGSKAGVVPLHVWLPRAHPEAPSHVSAVMSGAMVNLGAYGLIRFGWDLLGGGPRWWGATVLVVGLVSAMFGILHALVASDLKRLLAYSTTENLGLIFVGVGAAGLFTSTGNRSLAAVAMAAALLHVLNHAAFKGLLFLGAGSVLSATGTRDLDRMGGLARRMPLTAATFAIGGLALAALPPLNGFVSEWLLLQSLVHSLPSDSAAVAVLMPAAVAVVALTGGLAAAAFVKAFGTGFLAMPRSAEAAEARESTASMRAGLVLLALACVALAVAPTALVVPIRRTVAAIGGEFASDPMTTNGISLRLAGIQSGLSPLLIAASLVATAAAVAALARGRGSKVVRGIPPWGCGRTVQTARMEYTATSFAEPLQRVFDDVLHPEIDVSVDHRAESRNYIESVRYRQHTRDGVEARLYLPLLSGARRVGEIAKRVQNGSIHRYLAYALAVTVITLLVSR
jgi:formate hydrogenlyase subunit 3/multisubunit Na+/H+ antiporter MnhD subunit